MARPKVSSPNSRMDDDSPGHVYCGFIMHQIKSVRYKMRWGQLWTVEVENGPNQCNIALYKFDITNPKPAKIGKKDLKQKASFSFTEDDFCGLEKGQHITLNGMRRYICIILRDQHVILQDAIIAMTDTDHDVIQTWYQKITDAMHYMYRWRIFGYTDPKFLHVSRRNTCDCYSVHKSNVGHKGKILLDHLYNTATIDNVQETNEFYDGAFYNRVTFCDVRDGTGVKVSLLLEGGKRVADIFSRLPRSQQRSNHCLGFDTLDDMNPNLEKIKRSHSPSRTLQELTVDTRSRGNDYVYNGPSSDQDSPIRNLGGMATVRPQVNEPIVSVNPTYRGNYGGTRHTIQSLDNENAPLHNKIDPTAFPSSNSFAVPRGPRPHNDQQPRVPPRDPTDGVKKDSEISRVHLDTGYHTGEASEELSRLQMTGRLDDRDPYINVGGAMNSSQQPWNVVTSAVKQRTSTEEIPPMIPTRDTEPSQARVEDSHCNVISAAIRDGSLIPLDPEAGRPAYVNNLDIAITIDMLLNRSGDVPISNFDLEYSVDTAIIFGLEVNSVSGGDWRGLASELHMSFEDVQQIDSAVQTHNHLCPARVVLFHWQRTQAPYLYTRLQFKKLLEAIGRLDLAQKIPLAENERK